MLIETWAWKFKKLVGSNDVIKIEEQLADELHKPIITKFHRRKVYSKEVDYIWSADLIELNNDKGYKYALTVIDLRSRYAWVVPLKKKTGNTLMKTKPKFMYLIKTRQNLKNCGLMRVQSSITRYL